ncbi:hypothetical protein HQ865_01285 [Mucilaginibacter mali]|uniref:Uncharacterized protein n=1 Tax=Mucilaginibacter mali TaxID=2740462 RepID=A0A7D4PRS9_9SPHI|nr:hypothetical protein [Mucilaginibacter mali]QKJ28448.1 hypothetical protein HQ865_01285 [Mucilaginibacter mali]
MAKQQKTFRLRKISDGRFIVGFFQGHWAKLGYRNTLRFSSSDADKWIAANPWYEKVK